MDALVQELTDALRARQAAAEAAVDADRETYTNAIRALRDEILEIIADLVWKLGYNKYDREQELGEYDYSFNLDEGHPNHGDGYNNHGDGYNNHHNSYAQLDGESHGFGGHGFGGHGFGGHGFGGHGFGAHGGAHGGAHHGAGHDENDYADLMAGYSGYGYGGHGGYRGAYVHGRDEEHDAEIRRAIVEQKERFEAAVAETIAMMDARVLQEQEDGDAAAEAAWETFEE